MPDFDKNACKPTAKNESQPDAEPGVEEGASSLNPENAEGMADGRHGDSQRDAWILEEEERIAGQLRTIFDPILDEPIPEQLQNLLNQLKKSDD